ncbi:MAG: winged helix-turn-helix transcriptional regulator [Acidobacteriaceae bacterium]|nr:winged helix-turn-helix transcriptional regulator [Acidobacteriaceae bacterium]
MPKPTEIPREQEPARAIPVTVSRPELLVHGSDALFRMFVHDLLALAARLEAVRERFARSLKLTGIQYTTLISIQHLQMQRRVGVSTVASHLHVSGAFMTIETGKLIRKGLVKKQADREDRRRVSLRVTRKGRELLAALAPLQVRVNDVLFRPLTARQFRQAAGRMEQFVSAADAALALLDQFVESRGETGRSQAIV